MAPLAEAEAEYIETEPAEVHALGLCGRTQKLELAVPRLLQSCEHLASTQLGGLSSAPIRCRMQLQLTAARMHAL